MSRRTRSRCALLTAAMMLLAGCKPVAPFYLHENDDLAHYLAVATDLEYPDVQEAMLNETLLAEDPLTVSNPEPRELWDLSLEQAIQISLNNGKVLKQLGGNVATVYDPAIQETDVGSPQTQGVESALSQFDAQLTTSLFWDRTDRPSNSFANPINSAPRIFKEDRAVFLAELSKQSASGARFALRNNTIYEESNVRAPFRAQTSDWLTNMEAEVRQPLLRGSGTQVNRVPVMLARIRGDISLADFECNVRNHVFDVERAYWELYFAYRTVEFLKWQRDAVQKAWQVTESMRRGGRDGGSTQAEALARQEYYQLREMLQGAQVDTFKAERRLRFLLGLAPTDGRLIRPVDEPLSTPVIFDWQGIRTEALCRNCELRVDRWQVKQREMEMIQARNQLLPQLDAVALYRWLGRGDDLFNDQDGPAFPGPGSDALEELFQGRYEEWRVGVEMRLPVGFRRELAGVRNAQLQLARERALLQEAELHLVHQLTDAVQDSDGWYERSQSNFNRAHATHLELMAWQARLESQYHAASPELEFVLNALRRHADAKINYYRSLVNHTIAVAQIHFHKGSLLEYDSVLLAEGPWPEKAYDDAHELARQRSAGNYINYGFTRPRVISQGPYEQFQNGTPGFYAEPLYDEFLPTPDEEPIPTPAPLDRSTNISATNLSVVQPASAGELIPIAPAKAAVPSVLRQPAADDSIRR